MFDDIKSQFNRPNNVVIQFIMINVAVYLLVSLIWLFSGYSNQDFEWLVHSYLGMPSSLETFMYRPWTLFTNFFTHFRLGHVFWNMLALFWFGRIVEDLVGSKKVIGIYVVGGLAATLFYALIYNLTPELRDVNAGLIGASGAIFAISVAAATLAPAYRINLLLIGPVKLVYVVAFQVFMSVLTLRQGVNIGGMVAHLGGAGMGFLYIKLLRSGTDLGRLVIAFTDGVKTLFSPSERRKMKVTYKNKSNPVSSSGSNSPYTHVDQAEIDAILDKISASGYDSLTKKEKEVLFKAGKNN